MPRPRKAPELRQNRATKDLASVDSGSSVVVHAPFGVPEVPAPDSGWLKATVEAWDDLWASPLASEIKGTDMPALRRCFEWRDEQVRCRRRAKALRKLATGEPMVPGSKGQPVANPLFDVAKAADDEALAIETRIVALEDRLALSPKARLTLGVTVQKGVSLQQQNALIAEAIREEIAGAPDPRSESGVPTTSTG